MKKIMVLMAGLLIIGVNAFAAGDLIVKGKTVVNDLNANKITLGGIPGATQFPGIWFGPDTPDISNYNFLYDKNSGEILFNAEPGSNLLFNVGNNVKMKITDQGNVGIGTTSPSEKLEVNGNVKMGWEINSNNCGALYSCAAFCTSDKQLLGGGCNVVGAAMRDSFPVNNVQWLCATDNLPTALTAYAICANIR